MSTPDDNTVMVDVSKSDKELADAMRMQSAFKSFKFSNKHISYLTRLIVEVCKDFIAENITDRITNLEKEIIRIDNRMEVRDQGHDNKDEWHDKELNTLYKLIEENKADNRRFVSGAGILLFLVFAAFELFQ